MPYAQNVSVAAVAGPAVATEEGAAVEAAAPADWLAVAVVLAGAVDAAVPDVAALAAVELARDAGAALEAVEELDVSAALDVAVLGDDAWLAVVGLAAPIELVAVVAVGPPQAASSDPATPVAARAPSARSMRRLVVD